MNRGGVEAARRALRLCGAAAIAVAVAVQFRHSVLGNGFSALSFLSFFTIQSNLFAAAVLLCSGLRGAQGLDAWRGAATLYLGLTGLVYGVLLAGYQAQLQTTIPWVDLVLHRLMPLLVAADWLLQRPVSQPGWRRPALWLVYPLLYLGYSLLRGPYAGWYPYPFLNPANGGYASVAVYTLGIAVVTLLLAWVLDAGGRRERPCAVTTRARPHQRP